MLSVTFGSPLCEFLFVDFWGERGALAFCRGLRADGVEYALHPAEQVDGGGPFTIDYGWCRESEETFEAFGEALARYAVLSTDPRLARDNSCWPRIRGDNAECEYDSEGSSRFIDGLNDAQRDLLEMVQ